MEPMVEGISCPVCNRIISVPEGSNQESLLDAHVTRCLRQSSKRSRPISRPSTSDRGDNYSELWDSECSSDDVSRGSERDLVFDMSDDDSRSSSSDEGSLEDSVGDEQLRDEAKREPIPITIKHRVKTKVKHMKDDLSDEGYRRRVSALHLGPEDTFRTDFGSLAYRPTWDKLYEHQKHGCSFLWNLYKENCGGILADEMGLGE